MGDIPIAEGEPPDGNVHTDIVYGATDDCRVDIRLKTRHIVVILDFKRSFV